MLPCFWPSLPCLPHLDHFCPQMALPTSFSYVLAGRLPAFINSLTGARPRLLDLLLSAAAFSCQWQRWRGCDRVAHQPHTFPLRPFKKSFADPYFRTGGLIPNTDSRLHPLQSLVV